MTDCIWVYWEQGWEAAPSAVIECAESWEHSNPDYEVVYLSRENISEYIKIDAETERLTRHMRVQTKSDLYRLMLLSKHGGVWVDATLFCAKPLSEWLKLNVDAPVAVFAHPGRDRLVSSWFIASVPESRLVQLWCDELKDYLNSLPNPASPRGLRKVLLKVLQRVWSKDVTSTMIWWNKTTQKLFSLTPYFIVHYCYNRLALKNEEFSALASRNSFYPASDAHAAQLFLSGKKPQTNRLILRRSPVHKLNWRKLPDNLSIKATLENLFKEED